MCGRYRRWLERRCAVCTLTVVREVRGLPREHRALFDELDADGDGRISPPELFAATDPARRAHVMRARARARACPAIEAAPGYTPGGGAGNGPGGG